MHPALPLLWIVCQEPGPAVPPPAAPLDVVELRNGDELVGRITAEIDGYLEIELEPGAVLGLSMGNVATVRRGAAAPPPPGHGLPPRSEWFVLHDASGQSVGWLSLSVTRRPGGASVNEEYEFAQGQRRYQVTSLAVVDADGSAASAYFRERISEPLLSSLLGGDAAGRSERVVAERIVEAVVRGDQLVVRRLDGNGRSERAFPWPAGASFPLLARELARHAGKAMPEVVLFDPASEELVVRSYDPARQRRVVVDGAVVQVTELAETGSLLRNAEWIDASARTLRRELAGPSLVAMPSSAASARGAVGHTAIAPAVVAEAGGAFGLWVPNPAWTPLAGLPAGQVGLACGPHEATVVLARLDHLGSHTHLDIATDAVANWFRLLQPELVIRDRVRGVVRERDSMQLVAAGRRGGRPWRATLDVLPHRDAFLVLVCLAPERAWEELAADFAFLRRTPELDAQSLAPRLQGPLEKLAPRQAAPVRSPEPPPAAERAPTVRIPRDG